jgi:tetratricopeptide (TPR) repeat protein
MLCDAVGHAERRALDAEDLERLLWLLHKLGFNVLVCRLASGRHWRPDVAADRGIALTHALALHVVEYERTGIWNDGSFARLADLFPAGTVERADCSYQLVQMAGRHRRDAAAVRKTLTRHQADCEAAGWSCDPLVSGRLWSRYWRVAAFLPQFEGDFASMHAQMDRALACLEAIRADGEEQSLVVDELRWPYLESLIKAYRVSGDPDRALDAARRLVAFTPMQAIARLHLGESLADVGEDDEAVAEFRQAAALGPAGTVEALCYLGQYAVADDDHVSAREYFDRAFLIDPSSLDVADAIGALPDVPAAYKSFVRRRAEEEKEMLRGRGFDEGFGRPEDAGSIVRAA